MDWIMGKIFGDPDEDQFDADGFDPDEGEMHDSSEGNFQDGEPDGVEAGLTDGSWWDDAPDPEGEYDDYEHDDEDYAF